MFHHFLKRDILQKKAKMTMYRGGEFSDRFQELAFMVAPRESHKN